MASGRDLRDERAAAMARAKEEMDAYAQKRREREARWFDAREGLEEQVIEPVKRAVVRISTQNGIRGMGYFQHAQWLVSNAHVLPARELLEGLALSKLDGTPVALKVEESYNRPNTEDSPDLVIVNVDGDLGFRGISFFADNVSSASVLFYIDQEGEVKFIEQISKPHVCPVIYRCLDGTEPQPGDSGTAIIEAKIVEDSAEPKWQFIAAGALYARCSPAWYNAQEDIKTADASEDQRLICAIPTEKDFGQINKLLAAKKGAQRSAEKAHIVSSILRFEDPDARAEAIARETASSVDSQRKVRRMFEAFEAGMTPLNILLPEGLEKLWYKGIVLISQSLLIEDVRKTELGKRRGVITEDVSKTDLQEDFSKFMASINAESAIVLKRGDSFLTSPAGYLRVDITGGAKSDWKIDVQDNTGKGSVDKQPLSSVFAIVKAPKGQASITGVVLSSLLQESQRTCEAKEYGGPSSTPFAVSATATSESASASTVSGRKSKSVCKAFHC